jgi:streptogramin lyase
MKKTPLFPVTLFVPILIFLFISGCGNRGVSIINSQPPSLISITVTPAVRSIPLGGMQQFKATGTFSNGTASDLTNSVTWTSSDPADAPITAAGGLSTKAASVKEQLTISASLGAISSSIVLTITPTDIFTNWSTNVKPVHPVGVAVDSTGKVYIADAISNNSSVFRIYSSQGHQITPPSPVATTLTSNVVGVAVAPFNNYSGKVYVTDYDNSQINIYSHLGTPLTSLSITAPTGAKGAPSGVAVDSSGNIYVTDAVNNYLYKYNSSSPPALIMQWSTTGVPSGVAVDSSFNVYVADISERLIRKYSSAGIQTASWPTNGTLGTPFGIAVDSLRNKVYVIDTYYYVLREYDPSGNPSPNGPWSTTGWPNAVAVDPTSGNVYVVDATNNKVRICPPQ